MFCLHLVICRQAVDYWSLGVTVFKLLTGRRPFKQQQFQEIVDDTRSRMGLDYDKYKVRQSYGRLEFKQIRAIHHSR